MPVHRQGVEKWGETGKSCHFEGEKIGYARIFKPEVYIMIGEGNIGGNRRSIMSVIWLKGFFLRFYTEICVNIL